MSVCSTIICAAGAEQATRRAGEATKLKQFQRCVIVD